jgi:hypothetical protein
MDFIISQNYLTNVQCSIYDAAGWLIDWCLTSSEQFFSYIQDDGMQLENRF